MKIVYGSLDKIYNALVSVGRGLSVSDMRLVHRAKKRVGEFVSEREALRKEIIKEFDETGRGWDDPADAPPELVSRILVLHAQEVDLVFTPDEKLTLPDSFVIEDGVAYSLLVDVGFLTE